ncbi:hypothetical protein Dimus_004717 [Dionaea muscipula]
MHVRRSREAAPRTAARRRASHFTEEGARRRLITHREEGRRSPPRGLSLDHRRAPLLARAVPCSLHEGEEAGDRRWKESRCSLHGRTPATMYATAAATSSHGLHTPPLAAGNNPSLAEKLRVLADRGRSLGSSSHRSPCSMKGAAMLLLSGLAAIPRCSPEGSSARQSWLVADGGCPLASMEVSSPSSATVR